MSHYVLTQMFRTTPFPLHGGMNGQIKMQLVSEKGKTNWLNITPDQYRAIEELVANHPSFRE